MKQTGKYCLFLQYFENDTYSKFMMHCGENEFSNYYKMSKSSDNFIFELFLCDSEYWTLEID